VRARRCSVPLILLGLLGFAFAAVSPVAAQTTRYICFGDSITDGVGDTLPEGERGYPVRLDTLLSNAGRAVEVVEEGVPGEDTPEGLSRIDSVLATGGDVFLLMEGTNDPSGNISFETTRFNLAEMATRAEAAGFAVIHATTIPRIPTANRDPDNIENRQLNGEIRNLAGTEGRDLADPFEVFGAVPDAFAAIYWDNPDDAVGHPNAAGYDLMAEAFANVIRGIDTVPPVHGRMTPDDGDDAVSPGVEIEVEVWDFGSGVDATNTTLVVNGTVVEAGSTGGETRRLLTYQPPTALSGVVTLGLRAQDRDGNATNQQIAAFTVQGNTVLSGDVDRDGRVSGVDLVRLALAFGARRGEDRYDRAADLNTDDRVDGDDLAILANNFGRSQ
jgi:lysophospholipase L1-like esterase